MEESDVDLSSGNLNLLEIQFFEMLYTAAWNDHSPDVFFQDDVLLHESFTINISSVNESVK
jgi:hypothetical protein